MDFIIFLFRPYKESAQHVYFAFGRYTDRTGKAPAP